MKENEKINLYEDINCKISSILRLVINPVYQYAAELIDSLQAENKELREKLAQYEELEAKGLLVKLPCKAGECVYVVGKKNMSFGDKQYRTCNEDCEFYSLSADYSEDAEWPYNVRMCQKNFDNTCPTIIHAVIVDIFEIGSGGVSPCYYVMYSGSFEIENYYATKEEAEKALEELEGKQ